MLTQRTFWATIGLTVLVAGLIAYQLAVVANWLPTNWVRALDSSSAPANSSDSRKSATEFILPNPSEPSKSKDRVSKTVGLHLQAALDKLRSSPPDFASARTRLGLAELSLNKTAFDTFKISEVWAYLLFQEKKYAELSAIYEAWLAKPEMRQFVSETQAVELIKSVALLNASDNPAKSVEYAERWLLAHPSDPQMLALAAREYSVLNYPQRCFDRSKTAIAAATNAGTAPSEDLLWQFLSCSKTVDDSASMLAVWNLLCRYYPKPAYWKSYIRIATRSERSDFANFMWFQLTLDTQGQLATGDDAYFAQIAIAQFSQPASAAKALTRALESATNPATVSRLQNALARAREGIRADESKLDQLRSDAPKEATGQLGYELGLIYFDTGNFRQTVDVLTAALQKGQFATLAQARLYLGIAQLRIGDRDAARATLSVVASDPLYKNVATAWIARTFN